MLRRKQEEKDIENNSLHRWLTWFDEGSPPGLIKEVVSMDNAIKAANERQAYVTQDEEARRVYWSRRKAEHDRVSGLEYAREEGMEKGIEKGIEKGRLEIAKNLKANGVTVDIIAKSTGLSPEEIAKL